MTLPLPAPSGDRDEAFAGPVSGPRPGLHGASPPTPPTGADRKHEGKLAALLARATVRGERAVARTRLVILGFYAVLLVANDLGRLLAGSPSPWFRLAMIGLGVAFTSVTLNARYERELPRWMLHASVVLDPILVVTLLLPSILAPMVPRWYHGVLRNSEWAVLLIAVIGTGVRLSTRLVGVGTVANAAAFVVLLVVDRVVWGGSVEYGAMAIAVCSILFGAAAALGWMVAERTRKLVIEATDEAVRADRAAARLRTYVSEEAAAQALTGAEPRLGGERRKVAVLFADLRGFTAYAERIPPEELVLELNAYFEAIVEVAFREGGSIDKFIGDAIMVVFGGDDAAAHALRCAHGMGTALERLNAQRIADDKPAFRHGIGVDVGPCVVGNVGTRDRLQFTVVGEAANVASRLETATKAAGVSTLVSEAVVVAARRSGLVLPPTRLCGTVQVAGVERPLTVYTFA